MGLGPVVLSMILSAWWLASAVNQIEGWSVVKRLRRWDGLSLLPRWTFFAPNPAQADVRLLWRDEVAGSWLPWQEYRTPFGSRWCRWIYNPDLVPNKAIHDLSESIAKTATNLGDRTVTLSAPYLALLAIVMDLPTSAGTQSREFAIVRTAGLAGQRMLEVSFVSDPHVVETLQACADVR
ncbi:hypothetical protein [Catellatospora tritici]|uniref:hypothetical protein n=1 Tax=Catellatospora tritici TaxID=2851566 RepID=UPI001C2D9E3B|nr:hypothetical protein [Catellatospora tritici]MBV1855727.1 hypothetical protein [Catellatospora tritici]